MEGEEEYSYGKGTEYLEEDAGAPYDTQGQEEELDFSTPDVRTVPTSSLQPLKDKQGLGLLIVVAVVLVAIVGVCFVFWPSSSSASCDDPNNSNNSNGEVCVGIQQPPFEEKFHPIDPLTKEELARVGTATATYATDIFKSAPKQYSFVSLREPKKQEMLTYASAGGSYSREAIVILTTEDGCVYRVAVDLVNNDQIEVLDNCLSVQPSVTITEFSVLMDIITNNDTALEVLLNRGGDLETTFCVPYSAGSYGIPEDDSVRLVRASCYSQADTQNFWGRPIEGLFFEIDLDNGVIHSIYNAEEYEDSTQIPTADNIDFNEASFGDKVNPGPNVFQIYQKDGPSFSVSGSKIKWDGWEFHVRPDPRTGYYLSLATFQPTGQERRQVFYEASLAEMFVPYMEETYGWNTKTFFDVGEYGFGMLSNSLKKGISVPHASHCFDSDFAMDVPNENGGINTWTVADNVCVFERYHDTTQWLHIEPLNTPPNYEVRQKTTLVIRAVATLGNYDYILDMEFGIDGSIRFVVAATGILAVKGEFDPHHTPEYGTRMTPELSATFHDHWFSFRLDLDVDGPEKNTFLQTHLKNKRFTTEPRKSGWAVTEEKSKTEEEGKLDLDYSKPVIWRVVNNEKKTKQGKNLVSYALFPATNTYTLLSQDDYPQQRAAFINHNLWVTPYERDELFSSGWYPNQNPNSKGLPEWTEQNRNIDNTDVVLWYTMGFHHVPRQEDWPVMPTTSFEFSLMPVNFFEVNPSVDVADVAVPEEICLSKK